MPDALSDLGSHVGWRATYLPIPKGKTSYDPATTYDDWMTQNSGLTIFSGFSADELEFGPNDWVSYRSSALGRFGVVAVHDGQYSPLALVAPDASMRAQPYELASRQLRERDATQSYNAGDLSELLTWVPVTTLDGATRSMPVQIDPESLNPDVFIDDVDEDGNIFFPDGVGMRATVLGSAIEATYASYVPEGMSKPEWMDELKDHIAAFNQRAILEQPKTGAVLLTVEQADSGIHLDEYRAMEPATETPQTDYPVFGTHPMVEHIAANMIVGENSISVEKWKNDPAAPSLVDAYAEAERQNPLINYGRPDVYIEDDLIFIDYLFDQEEREEATDLSYRKAQEVAATTEGKSDTEKVIMINDWVTENTVYDYDSLARSMGDDTYVDLDSPNAQLWENDEFTAWRPIGVFRDGTAVCLGYAQAFVMIAREADLDAILVTGDVIDGGGHAWNRVQVDGEWKAVDPTWNDSDYAPNEYLLINESDFTGPAQRVTDPYEAWILPDHQDEYATP